MRKLVLLLPALIIFAAGCGSEIEQKEETAIPVQVYQVRHENFNNYLKLTGTITAGNDAVVYSKISERVERLYVKAGDRVTKDQRLAVQYNEVLGQGTYAAEAAVDNARAQLELADQNYTRIKRLFDQRAVSTQQFDQADAQLKAARSALAAAEAQLRQAKEQLQNSILKAPFTGVVAAVFIEENQMLPAGQPAVHIIDPGTMKANVKISSMDAGSVAHGSNVVVSVPSLPDTTFKGTVTRIDRAVDPVSKTLEAEISIAGAGILIRSGMYGEFRISTGSIDSAIVVPERALLSQTEVKINRSTGIQEPVKKYFLFVVNDSSAHLREIKAGMVSAGRVVVDSGLIVNDKVIVVGNNIVQDGQKVNIIE